MPDARTFVIIPGLNEEKYLEGTLRSVKKTGHKIIYVDDGSRDRSAAIAKKAGVLVIRHKKNKGKGGALRTGCDAALKRGATRLILMDADGQHDPADLPAMERALRGAPLVYTCRAFSREMPFSSRLGNRIFTAAIRILYGIRVSDALSGYRGMTAAAYRQVRWRSDGYQVEAEIIVNAARAGLKHAELPTRTIYHEKRKGTTPLDGIPILWSLLRWRFTRGRTPAASTSRPSRR